MQRKIVLLVGVLILEGCSKSFQPKNSTCNRVQHDLVTLQLEGNDRLTQYSNRDLRKLRNIAEYCRKQTSLSEKDYAKYIQLLDEIEGLNKDADRIIKRGEIIHSQRIEAYD